MSNGGVRFRRTDGRTDGDRLVGGGCDECERVQCVRDSERHARRRGPPMTSTVYSLSLCTADGLLFSIK